MSDDTLISLDVEATERIQKEKKEVPDFNRPYNNLIVEREIILLLSLLLIAPDVICPPDISYEDISYDFDRTWSFLFEHCARKNWHYLHAQETADRLPLPYLGEELLPDVCGRCFRSIGLCTGGRVRYRCRVCYLQEQTKNSWNADSKRWTYPWRITDHTHSDAIACQLIYKYHSPNGDRTWAMKTLLS